MDGTTLFYKDGWMGGRRCFIGMGGWTDDVVLSGWVDGRTTLLYKDGWTDDVVL